MNDQLLQQVLNLSSEERLSLIERLWDSLSESEPPVTPEEIALLEERIADLELNPAAQSSWEEVKGRLATRRR